MFLPEHAVNILFDFFNMTQDRRFPVPLERAQSAHIDSALYQQYYRESCTDPEGFWAKMAEQHLHFFKKWHKVMDWEFHQANIRWFEGAQLNACYNCVDRHLERYADRTALIWQGDDPAQSSTVTYAELHQRIGRFANVLKSRGVGKGDRVAIYMPMIPEAIVAMLACARIGAVHSVVFGGFSAESLKGRILDSRCCAVITADSAPRGGKSIELKACVDEAVAQVDCVHTVLVIRRSGTKVDWEEGRDVWLHQAESQVADMCEPESMDAEDPLFILYTSGSTGKPKGVLHTTAGYLLYAATTFKYLFDYKPEDVFWCTADVGWVTGHSYITYGPMLNAATQVIFEGVPTWPDGRRFWQEIDRHGVSIFYTAPTALRSLMREGADMLADSSRKSLRILGTVGEPINPEVWEWYHNEVGRGQCAVVDTWWQTETGGAMIAPFPGATAAKPGSATKPFFGIQPVLLNEQGEELEGAAHGYLAIKHSWPGQMRTVYGDHERFVQTYFAQFPGYYTTGDGAIRDEDGYFTITGRIDDVINISGHRLGAAEVESALVEHEQVAEAAVVGYPHPIKGEGIYAFVTPMLGVEADDQLKAELVGLVRKIIGPIATVDLIQWAPGLPKTRSGKIMRRILRKIAHQQIDDLGDTSTLADPSVVQSLVDHQPKRDAI